MKPEGCFCDYDMDELVAVARKRFVEKVPTVDLMESSQSLKEKDEICIVSLLDVDDEKLEALMKESLIDEKCDVISCRRLLKKQISRKLGVHVGS